MTIELATRPSAVQRGLLAATPDAPIDHAHLGRYTMGNRALEFEVLHLFAGQAPETLAALKSARCEKSWHMAAHALKGSARAVGAWQVARAAESAEAAGCDGLDSSQLIGRLEQALREAHRYICGLSQPA